MIHLSKPLSVRRDGFRLGPLSLAPFGDEVAVALGNNGAGKSTLFGALRAELDEQGVRTGYLPQTFTLPPFCRLIDACDLVAQQRISAGKQVRREAVREALEMTDLADHSHKTCRALSGGMMRRAGICLTLIGSPEFLMLDEPTVGLDITQRAGVLDVISHLAQSVPILMSTHLPSDLEAVGTRVLMLDQGSLLFDGTREDFLRDEQGEAAGWEGAYTRRLAERSF